MFCSFLFICQSFIAIHKTVSLRVLQGSDIYSKETRKFFSKSKSGSESIWFRSSNHGQQFFFFTTKARWLRNICQLIQGHITLLLFSSQTGLKMYKMLNSSADFYENVYSFCDSGLLHYPRIEALSVAQFVSYRIQSHMHTHTNHDYNTGWPKISLKLFLLWFQPFILNTSKKIRVWKSSTILGVYIYIEVFCINVQMNVCAFLVAPSIPRWKSSTFSFDAVFRPLLAFSKTSDELLEVY